MSKIIKSNTVTVGKNDPTADFNTADYIAQNKTDWDCIVAAYEAARVQGKGTVFIKNGTYNVKNGAVQGARLFPVSNTEIIGESRRGVIIFGGRNSDWLIINRTPTNTTYLVEDFHVKNLTVDLNNTTAAAAFRLEDTNYCSYEKVRFVNGAKDGWFTLWGSINSQSSNTLGTDNQEIDCIYDTHQGSLEMSLIFNQRNFEYVRPIFLNKGTTQAGPVLGLWQNCNNTRIIHPKFINNNGFSYYSITCDNTYMEDVYAQNTRTVFEGANVSDNTQFGPQNGIDRVKGLTINGFRAYGGINSVNSPALQISAVQDYNIKVDHIEGYEIGINFNRGNNGSYSTPYKGRLTLGTIKNCNPNNNFHAIHPGIYLNAGGDYDLSIEGGEIYDDRATAFQRNPISIQDDHIEPVLAYTLTSGIITAVAITNGGSGLPRSRTALFPLPISVVDGTGTGAVITAYTNSSGVVTSVQIINGGAGYSATLTTGLIASYTFSNIRINGSKLIPYNGQSSVTKVTASLIIDPTVEFNNIRGAVKGTLASYYDSYLVNNFPDASVTASGKVNLLTQIFAGIKRFSSALQFGQGVNNTALPWGSLDNLGTTNRIFLSANNDTLADASIEFRAKGAGVIRSRETHEFQNNVLPTGTTTAGFIIKSLTTIQRDALTGVADGSTILNTTTNKVQTRIAGAWVDLN
ncbi:MAG: hypothetical protein ACRCZ2_13570 [Fusobacteriaceae bacterium]